MPSTVPSSVTFPRFSRPLRPALALAVLLSLASGCSTWSEYVPDMRRLGVYKLDINQGNYITQDMVDKLREGQNKQQVRLILGTPLVVSAFRDNRWDYIYEYTRQGRRIEQRKFSVYFAEDKLARWEGDELPVSAAQLNRIAADRALAPEPAADERGPWARFLDMLKGNR
jgi:outer membrane protein assembly factor BamE